MKSGRLAGVTDSAQERRRHRACAHNCTHPQQTGTTCVRVCARARPCERRTLAAHQVAATRHRSVAARPLATISNFTSRLHLPEAACETEGMLLPLSSRLPGISAVTAALHRNFRVRTYATHAPAVPVVRRKHTCPTAAQRDPALGPFRAVFSQPASRRTAPSASAPRGGYFRATPRVALPIAMLYSATRDPGWTLFRAAATLP